MPSAILYTRRSRPGDEDDRSRSVSEQEDACRAHCVEHGLEVAGAFEDDGRSASRYARKRRPDWIALMERLSVGDIDRLVAWSLDRLSRNPRELEDLIDLCDPKKKGRLKVVTLAGSDLDLSSPEGIAMARVQMAFAAKLSDDISKNVRRAKAAKAARGEPARVANVRAFGWVDGMTPDPAEAEVIRESLRRLLDREVGVTALAREWTAAGHRRPRSGAAWTSTTVRAVLTSPRNAALVQHRGEVLGEAAWPAIVDRVTFERAAAYFEDAARLSQPRRRTTFTGVFRCGKCGGKLSSDSTSGRRIWRCKPTPGSGRCGGTGLTAASAEEFITEALFEAVDHGTLPAPAERPDDQRKMADEVAALEVKLDELAEDYGADRITRRQFVTTTEKLRARLDAATALLRTPSASPAAVPFLGKPGALRAAWGELSTIQQNEILRAVIEAVDVGPGVRGRSTFDPERLTVRWRA